MYHLNRVSYIEKQLRMYHYKYFKKTKCQIQQNIIMRIMLRGKKKNYVNVA